MTWHVICRRQISPQLKHNPFHPYYRIWLWVGAAEQLFLVSGLPLLNFKTQQDDLKCYRYCTYILTSSYILNFSAQVAGVALLFPLITFNRPVELAAPATGEPHCYVAVLKWKGQSYKAPLLVTQFPRLELMYLYLLLTPTLTDTPATAGPTGFADSILSMHSHLSNHHNFITGSTSLTNIHYLANLLIWKGFLELCPLICVVK